ncbi:protein-L-isoaspartate(D-aspartate) O-methyltransferase [Candidatus Binatia bacterium]|nr:protein-L-isoaspartate(D-aspartate) O-methyltransferase [Candidatus Binatia bacterium]
MRYPVETPGCSRRRWAVGLALALVTATGCNSVTADPPTDPADTYAAPRARLIAGLRGEGIRDPRVLAAIERVPRQDFVLPADRSRAYEDRALGIERGQTISQPYVVALMTELLELTGTERVLEVGTGSGYQAAVLALVAAQVYSIEIDPTLAAVAAGRLRRLGYDNVSVRVGDGFFGWPEAAPFDAVMVTAVAPQVPPALVAQLKDGGRLVMPLGTGDRQDLIRGRKRDGQLVIERVAPVAFVPMTGAVRVTPPAP